MVRRGFLEGGQRYYYQSIREYIIKTEGAMLFHRPVYLEGGGAGCEPNIRRWTLLWIALSLWFESIFLIPSQIRLVSSEGCAPWFIRRPAGVKPPFIQVCVSGCPPLTSPRPGHSDARAIVHRCLRRGTLAAFLQRPSVFLRATRCNTRWCQLIGGEHQTCGLRRGARGTLYLCIFDQGVWIKLVRGRTVIPPEIRCVRPTSWIVQYRVPHHVLGHKCGPLSSDA